MFVILDESIRLLPQGAWAELGVEIEAILHAHARQALLFWVSPADAVRMRRELSFGPIASAVLAHIERRSADYQQSMLRSERTIVLCDRADVVGSFQIVGSTVRYPISDFVRTFANHRASLFVENAMSDGRGIEAIYRLYCQHHRLPTATTKFSFRHGGGSGLCGLLKAIDPGEIMGLCICDSDVAPFGENDCRSGGTADSARKTCNDLNILQGEEFGYSRSHPVFAFEATGARTIEGLIGPFLLESYFSANAQARAERAAFVQVMPRFPRISAEEYVLWLATNLKDGTADYRELEAALASAMPSGRKFTEAQLRRFAALHIPGNVISWLWLNSQTGRFVRDNVRAVGMDLANDHYRWEVERLAARSWTMLAADTAFRVA